MKAFTDLFIKERPVLKIILYSKNGMDGVRRVAFQETLLWLRRLSISGTQPIKHECLSDNYRQLDSLISPCREPGALKTTAVRKD